jgi:hypothetical protein
MYHSADETRGTGSPRTATGERSSRNRGINTNCILDHVFYTVDYLLLENRIRYSMQSKAN